MANLMPHPMPQAINACNDAGVKLMTALQARPPQQHQPLAPAAPALAPAAPALAPAAPALAPALARTPTQRHLRRFDPNP